MNISRRGFLGRAAAPAIVYQLAGAAPQLRAAGPNGQIAMGFIGTGIRGTYLLESFAKVPGVKPVIACDLYTGHLERAKEVNDSIVTTRDYRAVLDRKDIDAVAIATPDHWHSKMTMEALAAGKHVYIEKPMVWSIPQGVEVMAAAKKSGKVLQVGSGAKTSMITAKAREIVKSGVLGKISMVRMENNRNSPEGAWEYPVPPDASKETIDWDRFIGPAPKRAYSPEVFFRWRCWWEYSGGVATDLFVHMLSQLHEVMDVKGPLSVVSQGGIYRWNDGRTVPDVMSSVYHYPNDFLVEMRVNLGNQHETQGFTVMGSEGTLTLPERGANRGQLVVIPEPAPSAAQRYAVACWPKKLREQYQAEHRSGPRKAEPAKEVAVERGLQHHEYFIQSIREGLPSKEDAPSGHYAAGAAHLANIAFRTGKKAEWDLETSKVKS